LVKVIYYLIVTNIHEVAVADLGILGFREERHLAIARLEQVMDRNQF
jgi:hypothetical protein